MRKFESEILQEIKALSGEEGKWQKCMFRAKHGDNPITLDIRYKHGDRLGKGISLTDEECFIVADELLRLGYCSKESIIEAVSKLDGTPDINVPDVQVYNF